MNKPNSSWWGPVSRYDIRYEPMFRVLYTIAILWSNRAYAISNCRATIFSRRILSKWARLLQWQVFLSFFFVRPQNVCVVDTFYRTTKSTEPASGITSELLQRVPPFVYSIFSVRYKTGRDYRVPPLNFFRHCATFFRIFFCRQTFPLSSFLIFCSKLKFQKAQRVPPF